MSLLSIQVMRAKNRAQHPLQPTAPLCVRLRFAQAYASRRVHRRLLGSVGRLVQSGISAHPALLLSFSVGRAKSNILYWRGRCA